MEAFQSQRLLVRCSYVNEIGCNRISNSSAVAGCGSSSFATEFQARRVSLSSSTISRHSKVKCVMNWTRAHSLCTRAGHRLGPNTSSPSPTPREVKFLAGCAGNWSASHSRSRSSPQHIKELLLVASHPPGRNGRAYFVMITTSPFGLWLRRTTVQADSVLNKVLKVSGSSIMYWLKRKRKAPSVLGNEHTEKGLLLPKIWAQRRKVLSSSNKQSSCDYHWRTPVVRSSRYISFSSPAFRPEISVHNLPRRHGVRYNGSTSDYYSYNSVSSQAEGMFENAALENVILAEQQQQQQGLQPNGERGNYLATGYGWRVRDAAMELQELIRVADIQTGAFHEKSVVFDDIFYKIFHAEVLSSLQYKAGHSDPGRYACLLAERDQTRLESLDLLQRDGSEPIVVGAVDITAFTDKNIVCHLPGAEEYLYVSGMAVEADYRRQGVATLLLKACLTRAIEWGFDYLVLHAYEDDFRARNVYSRAGYNTVSADPAWMTKFFGRRRRVVMARRTHDTYDST